MDFSLTACHNSEIFKGEKKDLVRVQCGICHGVAKDPVETPCGHLFGMTCLANSLSTVQECPVCKIELKKEQVQSSRVLKRTIEEMQFTCPICHLDGMTLTSIDEHKSICAERSSESSCPFAPYGCVMEGTIKNRELPSHLLRNSIDHAVIISKLFASFQQQITSLTEKLNQQAEQITSITQHNQVTEEKLHTLEIDREEKLKTITALGVKIDELESKQTFTGISVGGLENQLRETQKKITTQSAGLLALKQSSKDQNSKLLELKTRADEAATTINELRSQKPQKVGDLVLPLGTLLRKEYWQADLKSDDGKKTKKTPGTPGSPTPTSPTSSLPSIETSALSSVLPRAIRKGSTLIEVDRKIDGIKAANVLVHDLRPLLFKVARNGGNEVIVLLTPFPIDLETEMPNWVIIDGCRQKKNLISGLTARVSTKDPQVFLKNVEKRLSVYQPETRFLAVANVGEEYLNAILSEDGLHQLAIVLLQSALELQVFVEPQGPGKPGQFFHEDHTGFNDIWSQHLKNGPSSSSNRMLLLKLGWNVEKYLS